MRSERQVFISQECKWFKSMVAIVITVFLLQMADGRDGCYSKSSLASLSFLCLVWWCSCGCQEVVSHSLYSDYSNVCQKKKNSGTKKMCMITMVCIYQSLAKEGPLAEHNSTKEGVGALSSVFALERPCHVYSNSMFSKQIIGQTITYNGITSGFKVES